MSDIVERLRAAKDPFVILPTHPPQFRSDALCAEAAAEIERLREALRKIADDPRDVDKTYPELFAEIITEARAALEAAKKEEGK